MNGGGEFVVEVDQEAEARGKSSPKGCTRRGGGTSKRRQGKVSHLNIGATREGRHLHVVR